MARVGNVCAVLDDKGVEICDKKSHEVLEHGNLTAWQCISVVV